MGRAGRRGRGREIEMEEGGFKDGIMTGTGMENGVGVGIGVGMQIVMGGGLVSGRG